VASKRFKVIFSPSAQKDVELLENDTAIQIVKDIQLYLEVFPLPFGKRRIKKLTAFHPPLYRLRNVDFRAYYRIISSDVIILAITHKKDSEKILKKYK
jgi:mRNA-degrading endonuclease RelE of RelBE toxin-antitoxin system